MSTEQIPYTWPAPGQPFTAEHLDQMPDDGRRYEILDEALAVSPEPTPCCQDATARLADVMMANRASGDEVLRTTLRFPVELRPSNLVADLTDSKPAGAGIGARR